MTVLVFVLIFATFVLWQIFSSIASRQPPPHNEKWIVDFVAAIVVILLVLIACGVLDGGFIHEGVFQ